MLAEAGQALTEAAKQSGSITIAIPTAFLSSIVTLVGREVLAAVLGKRKRNGNGGPKPGEAEVCRIRGERMVKTETRVDGMEMTLKRYEGYFQDILQRLPKR